MKILHTADWHLGKRLNEYYRIEEQRKVLNEICAIAENEKVDVVLIAGDLYDNFNPANDAVELFYKTVHRLADNGKRAVIAIAGNHDSADRVEAPDPLAKECGILFIGKPYTEVKPFRLESGLEVIRSAPGFIELKIPNFHYPLRLVLTPYANELTLKHFLGTEDREGELRNMLEEKWKSLAEDYCDTQGVNLMMAHLYFMQKDGPVPEEPDDEKPILHLGGAQAIYTENIPQQMQYVALGHLHRFQTVTQKPCPVIYSSSPLAYSFSEANQQKFVMLIEAAPAQPVKLQPVKLQQGKRLVRKRFENVDEALSWLNENQQTFVELTLVTDSYIDAKTKKMLYQAHDGIVVIKPEPTGSNPEDLAGNKPSEITDLRTMFKNYFISKKGQEPNEEINALFNEIVDNVSE